MLPDNSPPPPLPLHLYISHIYSCLLIIFDTYIHREPIKYTVPETAEVFPTQPYSKNLRNYCVIHPEQINTRAIENRMTVDAEREIERIEKEKKEQEKEKADKLSEREKRKQGTKRKRNAGSDCIETWAWARVGIIARVSRRRYTGR